MKNKYVYAALAVLGVVIIAYFGFFREWQQDRTVSTVVTQTVSAPEYSLAFSYPSGEEGYSLVEPPASAESNFLKGYILMPTAEYIELQNSTAGREAPASISVFVFELPDAVPDTTGEQPGRITRLQNWAIDNQNLTSFNLAYETPEITEVDSVKALHYRTDGLYQQEIYLASYQGYVYMFVGQYNDENDDIRRVFGEVMGSVAF